ncbi:hypothetical protein CBR_g327 [Chara braunii]|uniref:DDE Tnp4 domain-containing protein n=1 Tax=Chara braunii TaxID=69332 RepID=A0A388JQE1_CHABU|nr:hypothetical protein CBR_g327 [Chara braunii]|eukprot:GBG59997.1 hypothetical protein CBR_g327 [Chara braunii]
MSARTIGGAHRCWRLVHPSVSWRGAKGDDVGAREVLRVLVSSRRRRRTGGSPYLRSPVVRARGGVVLRAPLTSVWKEGPAVRFECVFAKATSGFVLDHASQAVRANTLSRVERIAVVAALSAVAMRCRIKRTTARLRTRVSIHRQRELIQHVMEAPDCVSMSESIFQFCVAMSSGVMPRATPRWWMRRRTGGTWEDLRKTDDASTEYFKEKLRMSPRVFMEIVEALSSLLQRRVTFYRVPLQPDHIIAYALYRWASGETYESSTSSFGIGRTSGLIAVEDVTRALLSVYGDKIVWPAGRRRVLVLRAFEAKGFPNCYGCIDCTDAYVDKPANAPSENYFDRKHRFSVVAQVVVDLDLRITDVFVGYPGSCHDIRVLQLSSLWLRAEEGDLFRGRTVTPQGRRLEADIVRPMDHRRHVHQQKQKLSVSTHAQRRPVYRGSLSPRDLSRTP